MRGPLLIVVLAVGALAAGASALASTPAEKRAEVAQLERDLAAIDARAGAAAAEANAAIDEAEQLRRQLAQTRVDLRSTRRDLVVSRARLAERLRALYVRRDPTIAEVLVSGRSIGDIVETRRLIDRTARTDAAIAASTRERSDRLTELEESLERDSARAERRAAAASERRRRVQAIASERRRLLESVRGELKKLLEQERVRRQRLAALKRRPDAPVPTSAANAPTIALPGGSHVFPVAGPTRFTDDWLYPRPGGRYHQGIDLFAERGTPLVAVADGSLSRVGWNGLGGWRLWLHDGAGTDYYYAHLESFAPVAREGARVSRGTVLGYMGDSGSARGTGVHLHFEIHPGGGGPVRPWPYVTSWPRTG